MNINFPFKDIVEKFHKGIALTPRTRGKKKRGVGYTRKNRQISKTRVKMAKESRRINRRQK